VEQLVARSGRDLAAQLGLCRRDLGFHDDARQDAVELDGQLAGDRAPTPSPWPSPHRFSDRRTRSEFSLIARADGPPAGRADGFAS
jgi:hypothetical protein